MNADIIEPGRPPDALPGLLDADEISVAALGGTTYGLPSLARQLGQRAKRGCPDRHGFGSGFAVRQNQAAALEIDPSHRSDRISDRRHPVRIRSRIATMADSGSLPLARFSASGHSSEACQP
jgi:hypothetical protein